MSYFNSNRGPTLPPCLQRATVSSKAGKLKGALPVAAETRFLKPFTSCSLFSLNKKQKERRDVLLNQRRLASSHNVGSVFYRGLTFTGNTGDGQSIGDVTDSLMRL